MKRLALALSLLLSAVPLGVAADTTPNVAPADEYFGRMKLSIIGIKNELKLIGERVSVDPIHSDGNLRTCDLVEDALEAWAQKYPRDTWLQGSITHLEEIYARVPSLEGKLHLARLVLWTHEHLPGSPSDLAASQAAAASFDVPLHSADAGASPSPDPLDPATTPAPDATRSP